MTVSPEHPPATTTRRREYVVAAVVALVGALTCAVLLGLVKSGAELGKALTPGEPVTVEVDSSWRTVVWARYHGGPLPDLECSVSPGGPEIKQASPAGVGDGVTVEVDGERWVAQRLIFADPAGSYEVTCQTVGRHPATLSIGELPRFHSDRDKLLLQVGAFVTAVVTVAAVATILLTSALRRRTRPARLLRQRTGSAR